MNTSQELKSFLKKLKERIIKYKIVFFYLDIGEKHYVISVMEVD